MNLSDEDVTKLYEKFCEQRGESDEETAFHAAIREVSPVIEGAEDESRTWVRYSPKLTDEICRRLALGEPIRWILREKTMPNWNTIRRWLDKYPAFGEAYVRAMEHRADYIAHKMVELAQKCEKDPRNANGYKVAASILQWQAAMGNPKKYSERMLMQHEDVTPKDPSSVLAEMDRICKQLGVNATLLLQEKKDG
ncbi:MAG: putative hydrolase [Podoviridae sp. ctQNx1]|nr:MAG: putative hydrolase [Podoviridae sp. ctQNx1]UOF78109.1 terminase small subunit [Caudoviricetes sp.]